MPHRHRPARRRPYHRRAARRGDGQEQSGQAGGIKMLVLSRKKNESIVIRDDISIVVVEIRGDKVRLGVEAPKEIPVHRREVFDAIHRVDDAPVA
jgi:carbon storage regulator